MYQPIGIGDRHVIKEMTWVFVLPPFTLQKEWLKTGYAVHHRQTLAVRLFCLAVFVVGFLIEDLLEI